MCFVLQIGLSNYSYYPIVEQMLQVVFPWFRLRDLPLLSRLNVSRVLRMVLRNLRHKRVGVTPAPRVLFHL